MIRWASLFGCVVLALLVVACQRGGDCRRDSDCKDRNVCRFGFCREDNTPPPPRFAEGILLGALVLSSTLQKESATIQAELVVLSTQRQPQQTQLVSAQFSWKQWVKQPIAVAPQEIRFQALNQQQQFVHEVILPGVVVPEGGLALGLGFLLDAEPRFVEAPIPKLTGLWLVNHVVKPGQMLPIRLFLAPDQPIQGLATTWSANGGAFTSKEPLLAEWKAPSSEGMQTIKATLQHQGGGTASLELSLHVKAKPSLEEKQSLPRVRFTRWPRIVEVQASPNVRKEGEESLVSVKVQNLDNRALQYQWKDNCEGTWVTQGQANVTWKAPALVTTTKTCTLTVLVKDDAGGQAESTTLVQLLPPEEVNRPPRFVLLEQSKEAARPGDVVQLDVEVEDDEGHGVSFVWDAKLGTLGKPTHTLRQSNITWTAPSEGCPFFITVVATDERRANNTHTFAVRCP
ncbi:MAG: hypothetical protein EP343_32015 [Deltaproteobacteria bacterium]|nr:MAG: hypothetical protein EP343_32015 [Deltaproteobacteria bacterium]